MYGGLTYIHIKDIKNKETVYYILVKLICNHTSLFILCMLHTNVMYETYIDFRHFVCYILPEYVTY